MHIVVAWHAHWRVEHTHAHAHHGVVHWGRVWREALAKAAGAHFLLGSLLLLLLRLLIADYIVRYVVYVELLSLDWGQWRHLLWSAEVRHLVLLVSTKVQGLAC